MSEVQTVSSDKEFKQRSSEAIKYFFSGSILYWIGLMLYNISPYYKNFVSHNTFNYSVVPEFWRPFLKFTFSILGDNTHACLWRLFYAYLIYAAYIAFFRPKPVNLSEHRPYIFWTVIWRYLKHVSGFIRGDVRPEKNQPWVWESKEKTVLLYFLLKLFYVPIMLNFFFSNFFFLFSSYSNLKASLGSFDAQIKNLYFLILNILLSIDTAIFAFGYLFEIKGKSELRSVDPYFTGWLVALICYPPFNTISGDYIGWGSADYSTFGGPTMTSVVLGIVLILYLIYVWASVALGFKASNLTNRGIVATGPYKYVRHPAYITKNLSWIIMGIPLVQKDWRMVVPLIIWAFIYYLRALTEERHLLADPDYVSYTQKVKYRFIPGVY